MSISPKFRLYIGQCFWTGISIAYWTGLVTPILVMALPNLSETEQLEKVLYAVSLLGVGECLGAVVMGQIVDKVNSRVGVIFNLISIIFACVMSVIQIKRKVYDVWAFVFTFSWGLSDGAINTHCN